MSDQPELRDVRLLILDHEGRSLLLDGPGDLPSIRIQLGDGETTIHAARRLILRDIALDGPIIDCFLDQNTAHDDQGTGAIPVLIEITAPAPWRPPERWRWAPFSEAEPTIEPGLTMYLAQRLDELRRLRAVPEQRARWSQPGWYEQVCAWIQQSLEEAGRPAATAITQVRHWGISAVMRVDTSDGPYWFKAVFPHFQHEPAITAFLDRERPGSVAPVIGVNPAEGWLLLDDIGPDTAAANPDAQRGAIEHLVALQRSFIDRTNELMAAGCLHRSLMTLPTTFAAAMTTPVVRPWLDTTDGRIDELASWLADAVAEIDALGIPDTLVHGDFHPGNVALANGRPIIFDWSDAAVSNPLIDVVTWAGWFADNAARVDALWTTFLDVWADVIPVARFRRSVFEGIAGAYHAISYAGILAGLEPCRRPESADGLTQFYALLDTAFPG